MTKLKYLENTYLFEYKAKVTWFWESELWKYIILDETIFYPQWWGQPCDFGAIVFEKWELKISNVRLSSEWEVYHYYEETNNLPSIWEIISLIIDDNRRIQNAKNHSSWHLIDVVMKNIWFWDLTPTKWYHFLDWCYVEYSWTLAIESSELIEKLNLELSKLISNNIKVIITNSWFSGYEKPPEWKTFRYVAFEGFDWCGCWWTHINSSSEIWKIDITKVKNKWNILKVSYIVL